MTSVKLKGSTSVTLGGGINYTCTMNATADVNIAAGSKIVFKPGAKVVKGAKLKAKVGVTTAQKSGIETVLPEVVTYPVTSPYIGKVVSYNDYVEKPTGIADEHQVERNLHIFPNPSCGIVNVVVTNENHSTGFLVVSDIFGKAIVSRKVSSAKTLVDISSFPNGIYFVTLNLPSANYKEKIILNK